LAFTYTIKGETAGVGGQKRLWGTWDSTGVTSGTITYDTNRVYNPIGAGAVYSTAVTTTGCPEQVLTVGTLILSLTDSGAAGYWWVDVQ
jgi:hypothetical protein